jgi:hypothetical protein
MKFLGTLFVFAGYVFLYSSVAAGGKFATEPWAGLFADAYTGAQIPTGNTSGTVTNQQFAQAAGRLRGFKGVTPLSPTPPGTLSPTPPPGTIK